MLTRAFLFFRELGELTTPARGLYITPSRSSSADAGKSAHRPMGTAALAWSLFVVCLRQWSRECYAKTIVILHKKQCFIKCVFRVYPICTLCITRYSPHFLASTTYSIFYCHSSGFSISGSCKAALCFSAICLAVCCGCLYCCPACTGAVSAMP